MLAINRKQVGAIAGAGILLAGLWGATVASQNAELASGICRTDPMVTMNDGTHIRMRTEVAASENQVQSVAYTLHGPAGTTPDRVVFSGNGVPESVAFQADAPAGEYNVDTVVVSTATNANVSTTTRVGNQVDTASGSTGAVLSTSVSP